MAPLKTKGDTAEMMVAADLLKRGYKIAFPYGEDWDYDLIVDRQGALERVQVKYTESRDGVILVRCRSHSLTNGKVRRVKHYTERMIDWLAVYDRITERCYYVPAAMLGNGRSIMHLRLRPALSGRKRGINWASDYLEI
ncbi:MAG: group I intron-associated PD-(D/E)XK endonuclease [Actinomycetota bacterium]|nr:group I intron-associated PD-(D/E)XK endonuclease [Actinomycetota bacterium]